MESLALFVAAMLVTMIGCAVLAVIFSGSTSRARRWFAGIAAVLSTLLAVRLLGVHSLGGWLIGGGVLALNAVAAWRLWRATSRSASTPQG